MTPERSNENGIWNRSALLGATDSGTDGPAPAADLPPPPASPDQAVPPPSAVPDPAVPPPPASSDQVAPPPPDVPELAILARDALGDPSGAGDRDPSDPPGVTGPDPTPTDPRDAVRAKRRRLLVPVVGVLVLALLIGVGQAGAALFDRAGDPPEPGAVPTGPTVSGGPSSTSSAGPAVGVDPSDGAATGWPGNTGGVTPDPSTGSGPADAESVALAELHRIRAADLAGVSMRGQYVAQLASKSVGIVDTRQVADNGTHVFHAADILAEHRRIRQQHTGDKQVVLILSTDYGKRQLHQGKPLWITLALGDFATADEVTRWCGRQFPNQTGDALDNLCVARRLEPPRD